MDSETMAESSQGFTGVRFSDFLAQGSISQKTANGIKHEFCTEVQAKTLPIILTGADVYALQSSAPQVRR